MDLLDHLADADVLCAADARRAGIDGETLARHRRSARLVQLTRRWYAVRPPRDARDRHGLTATALGRAYAGKALVSHHSALVLLHLPTHDVDLSVVHLTRTNPRPGTPPPRASHRRAGLVLHQPVGSVIPPEGASALGPRAEPHPSRLSSRSSRQGLRASPSAPSWRRTLGFVAGW